MDAYGAKTAPPVNRNDGVTHADRVILIRTNWLSTTVRLWLIHDGCWVEWRQMS
jgi:hypothetical protein